MALPKFNNEQYIYELTVPSTKEKVKYRPFLVKEQKTLLIAFESQDPKQLFNAMINNLESCVSNIDTKKLATFDVDYMFTQVRSKSVGETSKVSGKCSECEHINEVTINLNDISVDQDDVKDNVIKLTDEISVVMKYPTYYDLQKSDDKIFGDAGVTEVLFETIMMCLDSVQTPEENISIKDESREEIEEFINQLTNQQLEKITEFVQSIPSLTHTVEYVCSNCNYTNHTTLKGFQDFF
jgi:hypothetical protein